MNVMIGVMVALCAITALALTVGAYYRNDHNKWREAYDEIEKEYRAETHIWSSKIADLERARRWGLADSSLRGPDRSPTWPANASPEFLAAMHADDTQKEPGA